MKEYKGITIIKSQHKKDLFSASFKFNDEKHIFYSNNYKFAIGQAEDAIDNLKREYHIELRLENCETCFHSKEYDEILYCRFFGDECKNHLKKDCAKYKADTLELFKKDHKIRQRMEQGICGGTYKERMK